ncbi:MAG: flippase-like domain-containing protein [Acidimicrobiales bacterium]|nr:flippase-like domain-containing protein [Acidimicrobiales bacterium]
MALDLSDDEMPVDGESSRVVWVRHPADVARMVLAVGAWLAVYGYGLTYPEDARSVSARLVVAFNGLPNSVTSLVVGLVQVAAIVVPLGALLVARKGRWREISLAFAAAGVTAITAAILAGRLTRAIPKVVLEEAQRPSWVSAATFPSASYLAAVVAAVTVLAPGFPRAWRRALWISVGVVAAARVITAVETPVGITTSMAAGVFIGSAVMVIFKAPLRWPSAGAIKRALDRAGMDVSDVAPTLQRHRHGPTYEVTNSGELTHFVKVVGRDERDAEMLARLVRALRVDSPEDRPSLGAHQTVEHEALALTLAARAGASVPTLVSVGSTEERSGVLIMDYLDGRMLDSLDPEELTPGVLADAFGQLKCLHSARIAHGWMSLHHLMLRTDGSVSLIDLRWAQLSATDDQLANDLAEMLMATAAVVGVDAVMAAATLHFDSHQIGEALPYIQLLAVSPETRSAAKTDKELLGSLRAQMQEVADVEAYELAKLERLTVRKVIVFVATLVLANLLLSMLGNAGEIWASIKQANPAYIPILLVLPLVTFPSGAASLLGAVTVRLPFLRTTQVMFAQSFLNRFTPANAGGMALRARYLQRSGVPLVNAASSVAITSAASGVVQVALGATFFIWAGRSASANEDTGSGFSMPSGQTLAIVVVVVLAIIGVLMATAFGRKLWADLKVNLASVWLDIKTLGKQPSKLILLFGGALVGKLVVIAAFSQTMRSFGVPVDFAVVGAMYITANTVASAAPTPGGVGAIEAALAAGLVGLGVEAGEAAAIVLVFRLFSYWLPILPCWLSLAALERSGEV